eukprot:1157518-Pelagomonas_calceolata.AAC.1
MHARKPQIKRLQEDADGHKASAAEFARGLDALTRNPDLPAVHRELGDTVRRMAIVQARLMKQPVLGAGASYSMMWTLCEDSHRSPDIMLSACFKLCKI